MTKLNNFFYKKNALQQIKGFYNAVRFKSISEAARMMNLTQSTVTLQIQSLERDLDLKLLKRNTKPISLTKDGEEFYKIACPLMQEFESVIKSFLDKKSKKDQKRIDIAVHHIAISHAMPKIISRFKKSNPDSKIVIRNISTSEALDKLKNDQIDLAFYPNLTKDPEIECIESAIYDPILIMNKKHPLVKKDIKSLKDLKGFDLIKIDRSLIVLPLFEEAVRIHQLEGSVEFENGNWEILKHFVRENNFVAIVSTICLDKNDSDLVVKNLSQLFPKMSYSIALRSGQMIKPIVQDFINAVNEEAKDWNYSISKS